MSARLILACSASKRSNPARIPAMYRYTGPAWRTLIANLEHAKAPHPLAIYALSAEHGLINAGRTILPYDRKLTRARAAELIGTVAEQLERQAAPGVRTFVWGGRLYRELIEQAAERAGIPAADFHYSSGGIGEQLGQLKRFLQGEKP